MRWPGATLEEAPFRKRALLQQQGKDYTWYY
jgi:hypothetical protein